MPPGSDLLSQTLSGLVSGRSSHGASALGLVERDPAPEVEPSLSGHRRQLVDPDDADVPQAEPVEDRRARLRHGEYRCDRGDHGDREHDRDRATPEPRRPFEALADRRRESGVGGNATSPPS